MNIKNSIHQKIFLRINKYKTKLFYIFTFGIGYLIAKKKCLEQKNNINNEIKVSDAKNFDLESLLKYLGGKDNIIKLDSTISSLIVELKSLENIDVNTFKSLGARGSFVNNNKLTILFGDHSKDIMNKLKSKYNL